MLHVIAKMVAKADTVEATKKELVALIAPTRKEKGCIQYKLLRSIDDPAVFIFDEIWESKELLNIHLNNDHLVGWVKKSAVLLQSPMDVTLLEEL
jgi:quinol monooxygenase YgiN